MGGVVGLDITATLTLSDALGFDRKVMALLLPFIESGMAAALKSSGEKPDG